MGIDYYSCERCGEGCLWLFWIVWITLTGGVIYGFYYLENEWLY